LLVTLDSERYRCAVRLIETSPAPRPKLTALLRRILARKK
jgi:hypothetical protein